MDKEFFKKGINFKCQGSSNCCVSRWSYGYVYLSKKDLIKIAKYLNVSINLFKKNIVNTQMDICIWKKLILMGIANF